MNLNQIFDNILFSFGDYNITVGNLIGAVLVLIALAVLYRFVTRRVLSRYFTDQETGLRENTFPAKRCLV